MAQDQITLSQAIEGYFIYAHARRLSPQTLDNYDWGLQKLEAYLKDDPPFAAITTAQIRAFLNSLHHLSNRSLINVRSGMSALWTWGVHEGLVPHNIVKDTEAPKPDRAKAYRRPGKRLCDNKRPTALRDRAIVILLLDTGIRASELCDLTLADADLTNHRIVVIGKGRKQRHIPISPRTEQAIWRYLTTRDDKKPTASLFTTSTGRALNRFNLWRLLKLAGERAGVDGAHPHRFRHTFAITFLRNGGNVFALQRILGHESLSMVNKYLAIAQTDLEQAHIDASPVTNWRL